MQTAANANLFFTNLSSFKGLRDRYIIRSAELRPQIVFEIAQGLYKQTALMRAADRFCEVADNAYAFRRMDIVEELGEILIAAPLPRQYESIGQYYQALSICRKVGVTASRPLFERVIDKAPLRYRARAMVSLGTTFVQTGDLQSARALYNEALRASCNNWADPQAVILSHRMIAVAKSIDGDHRGALEELGRFLPLARMVGTASPQILYDYLNGCAVELMEAGRINEARNISNIVLASPYAFAYPEWRETSDDIDLRGYCASRSVLSLNHSALNLNNVLRLPLPEQSIYAGSEHLPRSPFQQQASVTILKAWKEEKMGKKSKNDEKNDKPSHELDDREMLLKIVELSTIKNLPDEALQEILQSIEKIVAKYTNKDAKDD